MQDLTDYKQLSYRISCQKLVHLNGNRSCRYKVANSVPTLDYRLSYKSDSVLIHDAIFSWHV